MAEPRREALPHETLVDAVLAAGRSGLGELRFIEGSRVTAIPGGELAEEMHRHAGALGRLGVVAGDHVLLLTRTGPAHALSFLGAMGIGAVPCTLPRPNGPGAGTDAARLVRRVAETLRARFAVVDDEMLPQAAELPSGTRVVPAGELRGGAPSEVGAAPDRPAYVQCTSGSTALPKCVVVTHAALAHNLAAAGRGLGIGPGDCMMGWLPMHHDMGLVGCLATPLYWGIRAVFMAPVSFLRRPASWLRGISEHGATISPAPSFAYTYATTRVRDAELEGVDLARWRVALCGAEPIHVASLRRFTERFARWGLAANAVTPCYGLAEATLAVSFRPLGAPLLADRLARSALVEEGRVVPVAPGDAGALDVASCGAPLPDVRLRIADEEGRELAEGRIGRVLVASPSLMQGYHGLAEETTATLRDGWLDTGDVGYIREGELFVTGRRKDLVIIRGRNYVPSDFEWAAESVAGVRQGRVVAFGHMDPVEGTEKLCVLVETDDRAGGGSLAAAVRARIAEETGVVPAVVEVVPRGTVPRTTSGKVQRQKARAEWLAARETRAV